MHRIVAFKRRAPLLAFLTLFCTLAACLGFGGGQLTLPTNQLLVVDGNYGNDTTARRNRFDLPFQTLAAAKTAARYGDLILVRPATYNEGNLAKNGVNWWFDFGARVIYSPATGVKYGIFDTGPHGTNAATSFNVGGYGYFEVTGTTPSVDGTIHMTPFAIVNSGTVNLEFIESKCSMPGLAQDHVGACVHAGTVSIRARKLSSIEYDALDVYGGTLDADVDELYGSYTGASGTGEALEQSGGTLRARIRYAHSDSTTEGGDAAFLLTNNSAGDPLCEVTFGRLESPNKAIRLTGDGSASATTKRCYIAFQQALGQISVESGIDGSDIPKAHLDGRYIYSATAIPITFDGSATGYDLRLYNCEVVSGGGNREAVALCDGSQLTIFGGATFIPHGSAADAISIDAGNATIRAYGFCGVPVSGVEAGITATVGSITSDAQIVP